MEKEMGEGKKEREKEKNFRIEENVLCA